MKEIRLRKLVIIRIIYGMFIGMFIILAFFPYFSETFTYGPHSYIKYSLGYFELLFGGWVGIGLIIFSIILLNSQKIGKTLIFGISGCVLILINLIIRIFMLNITFEISLYLSFILLIVLFSMNVVSILFREKEVIIKPIPKLEKAKIEKPEEIEVSWDEREFAKEKAIKYIKRMQLKLNELPYFKIISKTGVLRKDLDPIVKELISNNEINALVRDFVIMFKKVPEEKKEEELQKIKNQLSQNMSRVEELINLNEFSVALDNLNNIKEIASTYELKEFIVKTKEKIKECQKLEIDKKKKDDQKKVKNELQQKIKEINNLIKEHKIKEALKNLEKVKVTAENYNLNELSDEVKAKRIQCKELELEIKRGKEQKKIKSKLEKNLSSVEKLIEKFEINKAIEDLIEIKQVAKTNEFSDYLGIIEDRIEYCKSLTTDSVNRIKNTILNYGKKVARLELVDISEKSGIKDENLIESVILGMIRNKEINAEYFSTSKAIAFYQQEKEAIPISKPDEKKILKVFLSYSTLDVDYFQIPNIVKTLEKYPEIKKVSYWQADSKQNIVEFMEETLKDCDVFVLFCTENSNASKAVKDEWQTAFQIRKKGALKIIPVYEEEELIPVLLWQMLNVKFTKENFNTFIQKLYEEILR